MALRENRDEDALEDSLGDLYEDAEHDDEPEEKEPQVDFEVEAGASKQARRLPGGDSGDIEKVETDAAGKETRSKVKKTPAGKAREADNRAV